jgi:hypothetical protein
MSPEELSKAERDRPRIDWSLIAKAVEYYQCLGYEYIEVPWTVPRAVSTLTWPGPVNWVTEFGDLVGSAEQSFLCLGRVQLLDPKKRYVAVSPCFRMEPQFDKWHSPTFMKVELYSADKRAWTRFLDHAWDLFNDLGIDLAMTIERDGPHGPYMVQNDIEAIVGNKVVELGSYGYRTLGGYTWSYGTGLAEPRTSTVVKEVTG